MLQFVWAMLWSVEWFFGNMLLVNYYLLWQ